MTAALCARAPSRGHKDENSQRGPVVPRPLNHTVREPVARRKWDLPCKKDPASKIHKLDHCGMAYRFDGDVTINGVRCGAWEVEERQCASEATWDHLLLLRALRKHRGWPTEQKSYMSVHDKIVY